MTTPTHPTPAELDALLEAAEACGPMRWRLGTENVWDENSDECVAATWRNKFSRNKRAEIAAFIAAANPATITCLVLMVRELQQECDNWKEFAEECKEGIRASHRLPDEFNVPREDAWLQETDGESYGIEEVVEYPVHERIKMLPPLTVEHFRARAVAAILTHQPKYASTVVDDVIGALAQVIESLPLVETEEE